VLPKQYGTSKHPLFVVQPLIRLIKRLCRHTPILSTFTRTQRASNVAWQRLSVLQSSHSANSSVSSGIGNSDTAVTAVDLHNSNGVIHNSSGLSVEQCVDSHNEINNLSDNTNSNSNSSSSTKRYFERPPAHAVGKVYIEGLTKVYGAKTAVNNLNLTLYEGVTTLLGHNSAGKSTTIGMLTGTCAHTYMHMMYTTTRTYT
jgi:ABC-type transport system involved in cytochrome bd biosynthesis fused ATPase/permease subunit